MARGKQSNGVSGTDHGVMRELNRSLVLDIVKKQSPVSRAAIARETSLAKPTVSAIIEDLLVDGLVREIGADVSTSRGGRPAILLEFNARSQFTVGVHILVGHTTLVVADALGEEVERVKVKTTKGSPEKALERIAEEVKALLKSTGVTRKQLTAVGVCLPGLVELHTGTCLLAPNLGWRDVPVAKILSSAYAFRCSWSTTLMPRWSSSRSTASHKVWETLSCCGSVAASGLLSCLKVVSSTVASGLPAR